MTGFGKVTAELPSKKVTVEIKALNSKQLDLSTRIPSIYKEKEMQIRSLLLQSLERGKVEFNIFVEYIGKDTPTQINLAAVENYYNQIKDIADRLNIGLPADWFQTLLRMPDVIKTEAQEVNEEEWNVAPLRFPYSGRRHVTKVVRTENCQYLPPAFRSRTV